MTHLAFSPLAQAPEWSVASGRRCPYAVHVSRYLQLYGKQPASHPAHHTPSH